MSALDLPITYLGTADLLRIAVSIAARTIQPQAFAAAINAAVQEGIDVTDIVGRILDSANSCAFASRDQRLADIERCSIDEIRLALSASEQNLRYYLDEAAHQGCPKVFIATLCRMSDLGFDPYDIVWKTLKFAEQGEIWKRN